MKHEDFQKYATMLLRGENLPKNVGWGAVDTENGDGWTLAHIAAAHGRLPHDFDRWGLRAHPDGETVAHTAITRDNLPPNFNRWHLADKDGGTVAHIAAARGCLPDGFSQWALADHRGWTVAHEAALYGHLPRDFDQWGLKDGKARTVADIAMQAELPPAKGLEAREREEIESLKRNWRNGPCWDIEATEGFEAHQKELLTYRMGVDGLLALAQSDRVQNFAKTTLGMPDNPVLAEYILKLHDRIANLEEKIEMLEEVVAEENTARKNHSPRF